MPAIIMNRRYGGKKSKASTLCKEDRGPVLRQQGNLEKYQSEKQKEVDAVRRTVSAAQQQRLRLQTQNESMRDALRQMQQEMDALRTEKVTLAADVQTGDRMRNMLEQQVEAIQQEMAAQQHEIERLREANA